MNGDARPPSHQEGQVPANPPDSAPLPRHGTETILDQALDGDSLYQLRASVAAHAVEAGLPQRRADDLVIAAHELAANVIRHGSGRGRLRIWRHDQALHCQVTDEPSPGGLDPSSWRIEPGHGLWLVRQLADSFSLHPGRGGSAVTISFALSPAAVVQPFALAEQARGGSTALTVTGQLDLNSADQLTGAIERLLAQDPAARIVVDLVGLTFWDAFGLAGLLRAQGRVEASPGSSMMLAGLPRPLAAHLHATGLADRFHIAADQRLSWPDTPDRLG